jgi:branched-chain amino acid transport system ATP-binding protein
VNPLLRLERITVRFGGNTALSDVSFAVTEGSIAALIGPNGAGKTTAFNVISGLLAPGGGRVFFAGQDLGSVSAQRRLGIGRTFQITQLFGGMTVRENVMVGLHRSHAASLMETGLRSRRVRREEAATMRAADELLGTFGLARLAERPAAALPLGQQRLLELARAVAGAPRLLMLDEAASGLSPAERAELAGHIRRLRERGTTILLVEHNMRFVNELAEHLVVLNYGSVIFDGALAAGMRDPAVISAYLGRHAA